MFLIDVGVGGEEVVVEEVVYVEVEIVGVWVGFWVLFL